jgi:L-threonylcarbamoyladenylate synthase
MSRALLALSRLFSTTKLPAYMETRILKCDPASITFSDVEEPTISNVDTDHALQQAANIIRAGECVAFPTETVYGLGADALKESAVRKIFATKCRPADNPLIVHVSSRAMLNTLLPPGYTPPPSYEVLSRRFWPGPLTLLYPAAANVVPNVVTAGQPTVGVRMPSHPVARALIAISGVPLAAPSSNTSGRPSPTRASHVAADLSGRIQLVLDGGSCAVGLESTVVDGLQPDGALRVLRPGGVTVEDMEQALLEGMPSGQVPKVLVHRRDYRDDVLERAPTTPGMKYTHYAPSAPVSLVYCGHPPDGAVAEPVQDFVDLLYTSSAEGIGLLMSPDSPLAVRLLSFAHIPWRVYDLGPSHDPSIAAQRLFDGLLTLDGYGVKRIVIEGVEEEREGLAVMNRARKAAGDVRWLNLD